jgi:HEAT repeat protein
VDAIGAHDEREVPAALRDIVRNAKNERARMTAVSWLGHWPEQTEFLAALVRDERELTGVRREAAEAIGESEDRGALRVLQDLYGAVTHREVKRELLDSMTDDRFADSALSFLIETARRDPDRTMQREAVDAIAEIETAEASAALRQLFSNANQRELKQQIVEAIADSEDPVSAIIFLSEVARNDSDRNVRESAIEALGDMDDDRAVAALGQTYDGARDEEMKDEILDVLGDTESTQALQKLMAVAQREPSVKLRRHAIELLGESEDPAAIKFLEGLIR